MTEMTTCPDCGIRYAADVTACPWCGHIHARSSADAGAARGPQDAQPSGPPQVAASEPPQKPVRGSAKEDPQAVTAGVDDAGAGQGDLPESDVMSDGDVSADWVAAEAGHLGDHANHGADENLGWVAPAAPVSPTEEPGHDDMSQSPQSHGGPQRQDPDSMEQFALPEAPAPVVTHPGVMPPPRTSTDDLREIMAAHHGRPRWQSWIINLGIVALLIVVGALIAEFVPLPFIRGGSGSTVATPTTPATAPTLPPTTQPTPASTATSLATTTTSLSVPPPSVSVPTTVPFIEPIQPPVPVGDLQMGADGIGPFDFGQNGDTVIGRLVASLGQPDIDMGVMTATGEFGACPGDTIRVVRWGTVTIVNSVNGTGGESFAAYRVDLATGTEPILKTLSNVAIGDTVADLLDAYSSRFRIDFTDGPAFELRSSTTLLLWGPLTSTESDGVVQGIYSPDICAAG